MNNTAIKNHQDGAITIPVRLDTKTFRRFALFDALKVKKRGSAPLLFSVMLIVFALIALFLRKEQAGLIAAVLLTVGLGLPMVYIGSFLSQINAQAERFKLGKGRMVYTITLSPDGIMVENHLRQEEILRLAWENTWKAWKRKDCIYLYATKERAFLLPNGQASMSDADVWNLIVSRLGADRCKSSIHSIGTIQAAQA